MSGFVPQRLAGDTVALDSVVVRSPLPGGVAALFRFAFNLPSWVQITAFTVAVIGAGGIAWFLWRHRAAVIAWLRSRSRVMLIGLAAAAGLCVAGVAIFSTATWNYSQHSNAFCVACHVMVPAYGRFQGSEHKRLECHDCHQQGIIADVKQVYYQIAERPQSIPPHAKVPNQVCLRCHNQDHPDSIWKQILATAGHRVHLQNDTAPLRHIQCTTCHGVELHRFVPIQRTCGQSGCHEHTEIRLGKMAMQTQMHCVTCHAFTRQVGLHLSPDSARQAMVPGGNECFGCHAMQKVLANFDPVHDPHRGQCGWCHNPHTQTTPQAAATTCTNAGCHVHPGTLTPLHRGLSPQALATCGTCHQAHTWTVSGKACLTCHQDILSRGDETRAAARAPPLFRPAALSPPADTLPPFSHRRHKDVACTQCHSSERRHGEVTLQSVRDCQSCHHASEQVTACTGCHGPAELSMRALVPTVVRSSVSTTPHTRTLTFAHTAHTTVACARCHDTPVTLAPSRDCESCHVDHHVAGPNVRPVNCRGCHAPEKTAHTRSAHRGCATSGCHQDQASAALPPVRNVCLVCHQTLVDHHPGRECARCHQVEWQHGAGS